MGVLAALLMIYLPNLNVISLTPARDVVLRRLNIVWGHLHELPCCIKMDLIQDCSISISNALEILQPWAEPSIGCRSIRDDIVKWKHFPRYWSFVRGIHRSPVDSPNKGQWRGALVFSSIWAWTKIEQAIEKLVVWDAIALTMTSL